MHESKELLWCIAPLAGSPVGQVINEPGWEDLWSQCQMPSFPSSVLMVQIYRLKTKEEEEEEKEKCSYGDITHWFPCCCFEYSSLVLLNQSLIMKDDLMRKQGHCTHMQYLTFKGIMIYKMNIMLSSIRLRGTERDQKPLKKKIKSY